MVKIRKRIKTDRLLLRPITLEDAVDMYEYASDPQNAYYVFPTNKSIEETRENINNIFLKNPTGKYGIELKSTGKMIGTIYLLNIDESNRNAELSYVLNHKFEGQGYAIEAVRALENIFFREMDFVRLYARHTLDNRKSESLMERGGLTREGIARQEVEFRGEMVDMCYHAIVQSDYHDLLI